MPLAVRLRTSGAAAGTYLSACLVFARGWRAACWPAPRSGRTPAPPPPRPGRHPSGGVLIQVIIMALVFSDRAW